MMIIQNNTVSTIGNDNITEKTRIRRLCATREAYDNLGFLAALAIENNLLLVEPNPEKICHVNRSVLAFFS